MFKVPTITWKKCALLFIFMWIEYKSVQEKTLIVRSDIVRIYHDDFGLKNKRDYANLGSL